MIITDVTATLGDNKVLINGSSMNLSGRDGTVIRIKNETKQRLWVLDERDRSELNYISDGTSFIIVPTNTDMFFTEKPLAVFSEIYRARGDELSQPLLSGEDSFVFSQNGVYVLANDVLLSEGSDYSFDYNITEFNGEIGSRLSFNENSIPPAGTKIKVILNTYRACATNGILDGQQMIVPFDIEYDRNSIYIYVDGDFEPLECFLRPRSRTAEVDIIDTITPAHQVGSHEAFYKFQKDFYEYMNLEKNPLDRIMNYSQYRDMRLDIEERERLAPDYLKNFPENTKARKDLVLMGSNDFYNIRGTAKSYQYLGRVLNNEPIQFSTNKKKIFQASGGVWKKDIIMRIESLTQALDTRSTSVRNNIFKTFPNVAQSSDNYYNSDYLIDIEGLFIQSSTNPDIYAFIERVETRVVDQRVFHDLHLSNINGEFQYETVHFVNDLIDEPDIQLSAHPIWQPVLDTNNLDSSIHQQFGKFELPNRAKFIIMEKTQSNNYLAVCNTPGNGDGFIDGEIVGTYEDGSAFTFQAEIIKHNEGYFDSYHGQLSSSGVLRDNLYYQNHSYILTSITPQSEYENSVADIAHPAGYYRIVEKIDDGFRTISPVYEITRFVGTASFNPKYQRVIAVKQNGYNVDYTQSSDSIRVTTEGIHELVYENIREQGLFIYSDYLDFASVVLNVDNHANSSSEYQLKASVIMANYPYADNTYVYVELDKLDGLSQFVSVGSIFYTEDSNGDKTHGTVIAVFNDGTNKECSIFSSNADKFIDNFILNNTIEVRR